MTVRPTNDESEASTGGPSPALTVEYFEAVIDSEFRVDLPDGVCIDLQLVEVSKLQQHWPGGREPFSLLFSAKQALPSQGQYDLIHDTLGKLSIFLVPVTVPEANQRVPHYEAIFS